VPVGEVDRRDRREPDADAGAPDARRPPPQRPGRQDHRASRAKNQSTAGRNNVVSLESSESAKSGRETQETAPGRAAHAMDASAKSSAKMSFDVEIQ
jgi:hypothetical protein